MKNFALYLFVVFLLMFHRGSFADDYKIIFEVSPIKPKDVAATAVNESLYESTVKIMKNGKQIGSFQGSVFPDDMNTSGKIKDGEYPLHLGFHKRLKDGKLQKPTSADLKVKSKGTLRPSLIVNRDQSVPCLSDNPEKKTSKFIHIHNGFLVKRYSDGCLTITPGKWPAFIRPFLKDHKKLSDWYQNGTYYSKKIGTLVVKKKQNASQ